MHPTKFTLRFGKHGPTGTALNKDGSIAFYYKKKPTVFALIPPDSLAYQLKYEGLWKSTADDINKYFDFLHSDPGYLRWPIKDKSGWYGTHLEEVYDKDVGYLEWFVNNSFESEVLKPLVISYMRYREALTGGFSPPDAPGGQGVPYFKDDGFSPLEALTPDLFQPSYARKSLQPLKLTLPSHLPPATGPGFDISYRGGAGVQRLFFWELPETESYTSPASLFKLSPPPAARGVSVGKSKKPLAWYVSNPDKLLQEEINSRASIFTYENSFGYLKKDSLWIPPARVVQYESDFFFISMYKKEMELHRDKEGRPIKTLPLDKKTKKPKKDAEPEFIPFYMESPKYLSRSTGQDEELKVYLYSLFLEKLEFLDRTDEEDVSLKMKEVGQVLVQMRTAGIDISSRSKELPFCLYNSVLVKDADGSLYFSTPDQLPSLIQLCDDARWEVRMKQLRPDSTYYEASGSYEGSSTSDDLPDEEEQIELSPADEYAVRQGEQEIEDFLPEEREEEEVEYLEETDDIYYETEEEMDFLGYYTKNGCYVMPGDRKFLES